MMRYVLCLACIFMPLMKMAPVFASDPYKTLKELPSDDASGTQKGSPYDTLSTIPGGPEDERHETLQNEYSAPENQGQ